MRFVSSGPQRLAGILEGGFNQPVAIDQAFQTEVQGIADLGSAEAGEIKIAGVADDRAGIVG